MTISNAIQHFRHILEGYPLKIYTDHKPLIHAFTLKKKKLPPVQLNQLSSKSQFPTDIDYIEGSKNVVADALSRIEALSLPISYEDLARSQNAVHAERLQAMDKNLHSMSPLGSFL